MSERLPLLLERVAALGHRVFDGGHAYNLNIVGIRSESRRSNSFDDRLACAYRETAGGPWVVRYWQVTTDPGKFTLKNPTVYGSKKGTAIVCEGQYLGAYRLDMHRGRYIALCQRNGPVKVYRDNNRDDVIDMDPDTIEQGFFGCNIHKAGTNSKNVDRWSAGCTVFARSKDFAELISLCREQITTHPEWSPAFTYTLIREKS